MRSARVGAGAGKERGEGAGGFGFGGGEPGRERQLVDADARGEVGEFGEQRGVGSGRGGEGNFQTGVRRNQVYPRCAPGPTALVRVPQ